MNFRYSGKHICVLVPTKDRPKYIESLLNSLASQVEPIGRIVIVASGQDIEAVVNGFLDKLPVEYYYSSQPGQIKQRNIGIGKLDDSTPLVACLDDDIELDPWAIKEMVKFWNSVPPDTGGVGFNITNGPASNPSLIKQIFLWDHKKPGRVLVSGASSSISHLREDIRSQWLNGGTTVWRKDVLVNNRHKEINTKWAIAEDLIFSYPLGKRFPLYVCAAATVSHNHYPFNTKDMQWHFLHGLTQTVWIYHLVASNRDLSKLLFLFTTSVRSLSKSIYGLLGGRPDFAQYGFGAMAAMVKIARHEFGLLGNKDIREE